LSSFDPGTENTINTWISEAKSPKTFQSSQQITMASQMLPLWYNHVSSGYIDIMKCNKKQSPFLFDLEFKPLKVDDFCRQSGLKRNTWRKFIHVEKDGSIVPALPLIAPIPEQESAALARMAAARAARETRMAAEARANAARSARAAEAWTARLAARAAPPQAAACPIAVDSISARERQLISLADTAVLPMSAAGDEEKVCVICHEDLMSGRRLAATGCGHVFCTGCISMSLRHNDICPVCRTKEPSVTVLYI
jgi:hypothetical protein